MADPEMGSTTDEIEEHLTGLESDLRSHWSERDEIINEMRALRFMEVEPEVPAAYDAEVIRTSLAYSLVERITATITTDPPTITVPPSSESDKAEQQSSRMEKWTTAALDEMSNQEGQDVLARYVECLVADGHGCMRLMYAPQKWAGYPTRGEGDGISKREKAGDYLKRAEEWKKQGQPLPVSWQWVDPLNVFPMWDDFGLKAVLEVDERPIASLDRDRYNESERQPELWEMSRTVAGTSTVKFAQLWTRDSVTYAVDGKVVHHAPHKYRTPPYVYSCGQEVSSREPGKMGMSVLYPLRYLLPYLDRLLSQKATATRLWCWPTPVYKRKLLTAGMGADANPPALEIVPGRLFQMWEGEEIGFLTWPGNGPEINQMVELIMRMVERAGLGSDASYGQSTGDSGYAINQLISAARMKLKPIVSHAERGLVHIIRLLWDIIEYMRQERVYLYAKGEKGTSGWLGLGPEDLNGYRQVQVKLNPVMPTDSYARSSEAINLLRAGVISLRTARERVGIEQPDDEERATLVDELKRDPQVRAMMIAEAAKKFGLEMQPQEPTPSQMLQEMPNQPPALQQVMARQLGMGGQPQGAPPGAQSNPQQAVAIVVQMLQSGIPPDQCVQLLVQQGLDPQTATALVQQALAMLQGQGSQPAGGGMQMGQRAGPNVQGMPPAAVMAAPGVQAAPGAPAPGRSAIPAPTVGGQVRPAGIATGQAPGNQMVGLE